MITKNKTEIKILNSSDEKVMEFIKTKENEQTEWDYYDEGIQWDYVKKDLHKLRCLALMNNNKVEVLCLIRDTSQSIYFDYLNEKLPYLNFISTLGNIKNENIKIKDIFSFLKREIPNIVSNISSFYEELSEAGFERIDFNYKYKNKEDVFYQFEDFMPYICSETNKELILQSFYQYLDRGEVKNISYETLDASDLITMIYNNSPIPNIPIYNDCNHYIFDGFTYFAPKLLNTYHAPENTRFITAISTENILGTEKKRIVGVLKIADYRSDFGKYTGLNFVDVHVNYRRMNIATKLYEKLNEILTKDDFLISSFLSDEGKEAKVNEIQKKTIHNCPAFLSQMEYYEFMREKSDF